MNRLAAAILGVFILGSVLLISGALAYAAALLLVEVL